MPVNDDLQDRIITQEFQNLRVIAGLQRTVDRRLRRLGRELRDIVHRVDPEGVVRPAAKARRQARIETLTQTTVRAAYSEINAEVRQALQRLGIAQSQAVANAMTAVLPAAIVAVEALRPVVLSRQIARSLATQTIIEGTVMRDHWRRISTRTRLAVGDTIRAGIRDGLSNTQISAQIVGGKVNGVQFPGVMNTPRRNAEALVRTAVNGILNTSRMRTFQENTDIVKALQQITTFDSRTSDICIAYSGQTWNAETLEPIPPSTLPFNGGPPRHFNCRSTLVPILKGSEEFPDIDLSPTTRASMDGQIPADTTFDQFLKGKSKTFQDEMLGPARARLWRSGKMTLTDLVNMRGNPMTLNQLEAKIAGG